MFQGYLLACLLSLGVTVSNSFARFAYALMLPAMRAELDWTYAESGWLNTANAIGYLIGAVGTRVLVMRLGNRTMFIAGLVLTALAILATGFTRDLNLLAVARLLAGVFGAAVFVCGGALASNVFPQRPDKASTTVAIYFAGGGIGFLLCGVAIPMLLETSGPSAWPLAWIWMGGAGLVMWIVAAFAALRIVEPNVTSAGSAGEGGQRDLRGLGAAIVAYSMFGLGYIGYMTFIIAWMRDNGGSTNQVIAVWSMFGIASLLGPWVWSYPLRHWVGGRMLSAAMAMLAAGALLPLLDARFVSVMMSAALFGASMWNIPGSVTNLVKRARRKPAWGPVMATFTIVFATGQIIGPVFTGWLADLASLKVGLAVSVALLLFGAAVALLQRDVVEAPAGRGS